MELNAAHQSYGMARSPDVVNAISATSLEGWSDVIYAAELSSVSVLAKQIYSSSIVKQVVCTQAQHHTAARAWGTQTHATLERDYT